MITSKSGFRNNTTFLKDPEAKAIYRSYPLDMYSLLTS